MSNDIKIEDIDYIKYLSRIWNIERIAKSISTLDKEFYKKYNQFISSPNYTEQEKEKHQIEMNTFFRKRMGYIASCASATKLTPKFANQLTNEEIQIYNQINNIIVEFNNTIQKIR